jgi:hypothetical protein
VLALSCMLNQLFVCLFVRCRCSIFRTLLPAGMITAGVTNRVDLYHTVTKTWTQAALSSARAFACGCGNFFRLAFVGGATSLTAGFSNVIDLYDVASRTWTTATLQTARSRAACALFDNGNTLVVGGGQTGASTWATDLVLLTISSNTWSSVGSLSAAYEALAYSNVGDFLVIAGFPGSGTAVTLDVYQGPRAAYLKGFQSISAAGLSHVSVAFLGSGNAAMVAGGANANIETATVATVFATATLVPLPCLMANNLCVSQCNDTYWQKTQTLANPVNMVADVICSQCSDRCRVCTNDVWCTKCYDPYVVQYTDATHATCLPACVGGYYNVSGVCVLITPDFPGNCSSDPAYTRGDNRMPHGYAVTFTTSSSAVLLPSFAASLPMSFTAWVYSTNVTAGPLFDFSSGTNAHTWALGVMPWGQAAGSLAAYWNTATGDLPFAYFPSFTFPTNTWIHVVLTVDVAWATPILYVNGIKQRTVFMTPGSVASPAASADTLATRTTMLIGAARPYTTAEQGKFPFANRGSFLGSMMDVRLFSRVLTPAEVMLMLAGTEKNVWNTGCVYALCPYSATTMYNANSYTGTNIFVPVTASIVTGSAWGFSTPTAVSTSFVCRPGYYNPWTGGFPCTACPAGTYSDRVGAKYCTSCPSVAVGTCTNGVLTLAVSPPPDVYSTAFCNASFFSSVSLSRGAFVAVQPFASTAGQTVALWVRDNFPLAVASPVRYFEFSVTMPASATNNPGMSPMAYMIYLAKDTTRAGGLTVAYYSSTGALTCNVQYTGFTIPDASTWFHVAVVFPTTATTPTLYFNGLAATANVLTVCSASIPTTASTVLRTSVQFGVGNAPGTMNDFQGSMGNIRLFGVPLTAADVQQMFTNVDEATMINTQIASVQYVGCVGVYQNAVQTLTHPNSAVTFVGGAPAVFDTRATSPTGSVVMYSYAANTTTNCAAGTYLFRGACIVCPPGMWSTPLATACTISLCMPVVAANMEQYGVKTMNFPFTSSCGNSSLCWNHQCAANPNFGRFDTTSTIICQTNTTNMTNIIPCYVTMKHNSSRVYVPHNLITSQCLLNAPHQESQADCTCVR